MSFINLMKDIIAPKKCYSCKREGHFLCESCFHSLHNFSPECYICKKPSTSFQIHNTCKKGIYFDAVVILSHYKNHVIQKLIKDAKFYGKKDILEDFSKYMSIQFLLNNPLIKKEEYIVVPVPMFFIRKLLRGYNQTEVLAKIIAKNTGIEYGNNIIKRVKNTRQQSKLSQNERSHNLEKAFKINKNHIDKLDNKKVILVDDVISTGTTLNVISKLLKENGVTEIITLNIASD